MEAIRLFDTVIWALNPHSVQTWHQRGDWETKHKSPKVFFALKQNNWKKWDGGDPNFNRRLPSSDRSRRKFNAIVGKLNYGAFNYERRRESVNKCRKIKLGKRTRPLFPSIYLHFSPHDFSLKTIRAPTFCADFFTANRSFNAPSVWRYSKAHTLLRATLFETLP